MYGEAHALKGLMAKIETDRKNEAKLKEMYASNRGGNFQKNQAEATGETVLSSDTIGDQEMLKTAHG